MRRVLSVFALLLASISVAKASPWKPLSDADETRYRKIFTAQEKGDWQSADALIAKLENKVLLGYVLEQRYMHPTAYRSSYPELRRWLAAPVLAWALVALLSVLLVISSHKHGGPIVYLRSYIAMALVGTIMHCNLRPLLAVLESRPAQHIARISYALYIWHMLMVFGWMNEGTTFERYALKRPVSWALTWAAAYASTTWWESYWQARVRQWLARRPAGA